jgi:hypothetical protein
MPAKPESADPSQGRLSNNFVRINEGNGNNDNSILNTNLDPGAMLGSNTGFRASPGLQNLSINASQMPLPYGVEWSGFFVHRSFFKYEPLHCILF